VLGSMRWTSASWRSARSLTARSIWTGLVASAMLSSGCGASKLAIPDERIPHQVAQEGEVTVWVRLSSGDMTPVKVRVLPGWWVASPLVIDGPR